MEWSDVRIFLAIAREGSLGAAARAVGQTQPTMGRRLRALEAAVGQSLFQRTPDGFVLTDEGTAVMASAERMEEEALAFERQLAGHGSALGGSLRLATSDWFGSYVLTPVLAEFARRHAAVTVELLTDSRLYSLARREADLAFRIKPFDEPDVISRRLLRMPYALYTHRDQPRPRKGGRGTRLVTMNAAFGGMPDVAWLKKHLPEASVAFTSNSREVQARMCMQGIGAAVLPTALGDAFGELKRIDLGDPPPSRDTWIGYHKDLKRLGRLRRLLELLSEQFPS
ncbi:MAG: LysR family transcriptional regulator [Lysobacterales bacterium 14-68-21]|jgi:DNA-binding transcriptional LysR family regulator|nr:MAG: LysR family transcriptional regulator [Xanthomonadales bacterium 15-68-25]OZB65733.1 MAG: LysR family transcriptional regulator [Xanthomonadales bacterium 14-68-21]